MRAVENPEVASTLSRTVTALDKWDKKSSPPDDAYAAFATDLAAITEQSEAGGLARRLNSEISGARSLVMSTYRALPFDKNLSPPQVKAHMLEIDARWAEPGYWQAIAKNGSRWTPDYLLASVDLKRDIQGDVVKVDADSAAFFKILLRTFEISAIVTVFCLLLGYPLAYWLSRQPARRANLLLILVLLPFWTSLIVRTASWIVLLQSGGLINNSLIDLGILDKPLQLVFNRAGVLISMTHILLPFLILPLYAVMKGIDSRYERAAISLGAHPYTAFRRVYLPQTYAGVTAGALLVFIMAIGYYITPALLGGPGDQMLSYFVAYYTNTTINWGMATALGGQLLIIVLLLYWVYAKISRPANRAA